VGSQGSAVGVQQGLEPWLEEGSWRNGWQALRNIERSGVTAAAEMIMSHMLVCQLQVKLDAA